MPLNRPTQAELLDAVAGYRRQPVQDAGMDAFLQRVAASVLDICQRETLHGDAYTRRDQAFCRALMDDLGCRDLAALGERLAAGVDDAWLATILPGWLALAHDKLQIDSPKYPR